MRFPGVLGSLFAAVVVGSVADWQYHAWLVRHSVSQLHGRYTVGMQLQPVRSDVQLHYGGYTEYSADDCTKWAKVTFPTYHSLGGPCIFGIYRAGQTWWGFESAVQFKLIFDPDGILRSVDTDPVYTFL